MPRTGRTWAPVNEAVSAYVCDTSATGGCVVLKITAARTTPDRIRRASPDLRLLPPGLRSRILTPDEVAHVRRADGIGRSNEIS